MRGVMAAGDRITRQRRRQGLTQEQLAAQADCDVKTVRRAEHSGVIDMKSLKAIAAALNATHTELVVSAPSSGSTLGESLEVQSILRRWLRAFGDNDFDRVLPTVHRGAVLYLPGDNAVLYSGEHRGLKNIRTVLMRLVTSWTPRCAFKWSHKRLIEAKEAFIPFQLVWCKSMGTERETTPALFYMRLRNRKVSRLQIYWDTLTILEAMEANHE